MTSLDQRLSRPARLALVCVVCVLPLRYILNRFSPETYFTSLIYYGEYFFPNAIPEVRQIKPKISSFAGYDGQFYSQIAIHPSLRTPGLKESLDAPAYRAMRPLLPWLSYLAGFGRPFWIVQAYALSNLLFWYLLVFWLLHYLRPTSRRDYLCILAACTSSGVLFSLQRALLDLPAATLCFFGASLTEKYALVAIAGAVLTKETYVLQLVERRFRRGKTGSIAAAMTKYGCILVPVLLWHGYVRFTFGPTHFGANFGWPFSGYLAAILKAIRTLPYKHFSFSSITSLLAPLSLLVQGFYLFWAPRCGAIYRRTGMAFAISSIFLSSDVFVEQVSYCRDLIPVSIAFNITLMQNKLHRFVFWFVTGNLGLTMGLVWLIRG